MHLTLRQLRYFVAVIDAGSMTRAAENLHVAPTALSLQMKSIEEHFGVSLIRRHSRGVVATDKGAEFYGRARQILELVEETEQAIAPGSRQAARRLNLGVPPGLARIVGVEAFLGVSARLEGIALQVTEGWSVALEKQLANGELDVVVGYGLEPSETIHVRDLIEDRLVFVSAPGEGAKGEPIPLDEVLRSQLVFYGEQSMGWRVARGAAQAAGIPLAAERQVGSIAVWRELMCRGLGTSIAPSAVIAEEHRQGRVAIREIEGDPISLRVSLGIRRELLGESWAPGLIDFIAELVLEAPTRLGPVPEAR